ncbi:hypothetical protein QBC37DRAFT_406126 [Rhypophila decipiens]|uniref:Uncharacterized protein n=1 Tax=Rhypophila decipiens TaxID=261697 RepID=A0AAN6XVU0_9PEZI|nr:hypothetical protein QBC37DRAFT_406126 [Rhypophila decipiens]
MDQLRYENNKDRIRVQMDLRPPTSESGSSAPWTIPIDLELSRSHLAYIMDNGFFLQHPARYIVPCYRVNTPKREWEIREFPDEAPAVSRWSGRITLFPFGQDARQNFPGLEVLHQSMIHFVSIWSRTNEEMMFEYNQAANVNYNNINDDEPHQCLRRFWTGDQSINMSDLAAATYRGDEENGCTTGALVARGDKGESAVGRAARREHTAYHEPAHGRRAEGDRYFGQRNWPDVAVELIHAGVGSPIADGLCSFLVSLGWSIRVLAVGTAARWILVA